MAFVNAIIVLVIQKKNTSAEDDNIYFIGITIQWSLGGRSYLQLNLTLRYAGEL